ncbi:hypothetical protein [Gloeothece verrucosa]|uniref:Uncharacterized protein n=1 Tax=Gloeothece verrucosa (strain PCC 7822) TaxID=497965 RepID=E0U5G2_GLOV7|nr:hypothetical protein [Gloeothece verrucosa]ADN13552.1 hypothetical protein Cyan7822_1560 [Gloeothece verrucosa PCC 7822]
MTTIICVSNVVQQLEHLFECWQFDEDELLIKNGYLKPEYSNQDFSVQICISAEFVVELEKVIFPEIELTINHLHWIEDNYDNFLAVDVLSGWYHWMSEKLYYPQIVAFALNLTNQIRSALSIPPLVQLVEDDCAFLSDL